MSNPSSSKKTSEKPPGQKTSQDVSWSKRRDEFHTRLHKQPIEGIEAEEIEIHFEQMPSHYWERVTEEDLVWGLQSINSFLKLVATPNVPPTKPVVAWQQIPELGQTRVMLCTWDRHGLLAKASAALSLVHLNILKADVFTRGDNVVLDVFTVTDSDGRGPATKSRLEEMSFVLEGALSEPPRFVSVWACSRHKFLAPPSKTPPQIEFDNESSATSTAVNIQVTDRLGLLYDILHTLADSGFDITEAHIATDDAQVNDTIYFTDPEGRKVTDVKRLEELRQNLLAELTIA